MSRVRRIVTLIVFFAILCVIGGCQSGGKKQVKLNSDNYQDYVNITIDRAGRTVEVKAESKSKDYIFEDVTATIYYTYNICKEETERVWSSMFNEWRDVRTGSGKIDIVRYDDGTTGENQSGHVEIVLNRDGSCDITEKLGNDQNHTFDSDNIMRDLNISKIEFKSGTVRKNELEN